MLWRSLITDRSRSETHTFSIFANLWLAAGSKNALLDKNQTSQSPFSSFFFKFSKLRSSCLHARLYLESFLYDMISRDIHNITNFIFIRNFYLLIKCKILNILVEIEQY